MTEKEILEQLYYAEQLAHKKKSQRFKIIYAFFAIIAFVFLKTEGNGILESLLLAVFCGGFFTYIFLLLLSVLMLVLEVDFSLPEDKSVNYWKEKLHEVRGEDYYRNFFNK